MVQTFSYCLLLIFIAAANAKNAFKQLLVSKALDFYNEAQMSWFVLKYLNTAG